MKPVYVKKWHGINLSTLADGDRDQLPDNKFYSKFYKEFFKCHHDWQDLESKWVDHKLNIARFILSRLPKHGRTLSIGCGLGIIEKFLLKSTASQLEIQEVSDEPLRWVKPLFPKETVHIGFFPDCLNSYYKFDYIYIAAVDACFSQKEWVVFLKSIRENLNENGRCLIIAAPTFHGADYSWEEINIQIKTWVKHVLSFFGLYDLGLMMGWRRSRSEFLDAMKKADFDSLDEGFLNRDALVPKTFWVEGSLKSGK